MTNRAARTMTTPNCRQLYNCCTTNIWHIINCYWTDLSEKIKFKIKKYAELGDIAKKKNKNCRLKRVIWDSLEWLDSYDEWVYIFANANTWKLATKFWLWSHISYIYSIYGVHLKFGHLCDSHWASFVTVYAAPQTG